MRATTVTAAETVTSWPAAVTETSVPSATSGRMGARNVKFQAPAKAAAPRRARMRTLRRLKMALGPPLGLGAPTYTIGEVPSPAAAVTPSSAATRGVSTVIRVT